MNLARSQRTRRAALSCHIAGRASLEIGFENEIRPAAVRRPAQIGRSRPDFRNGAIDTIDSLRRTAGSEARVRQWPLGASTASCYR